jgi:salicylate hydroxylase
LSGLNAKPHVLIAGGGIGGLTAALALLKRGLNVDIFEQAPELKGLGAGIQLSPNGTRALFELGLAAELNDIACQPKGKEIRLWNTGQTWNLFDLGAESIARYGFPYVMIHRGDLHTILANAVRREKSGAIHVNAVCVGCTQDERGVMLGFADGTQLKGDALIGADGVHSRIRQTLFGGDHPKFSGCLAWRGVIPARRLPAHLLRNVGTNWIGPRSHVIHYPLRRGELMNFVGIVERDDWQVESWTEQGTIEECEHDFSGWHEDVHRLIHSLNTPYKWALMVREPMKRWTIGKISLLGDACHPTLPMLAQGGVMAIEDGYVLARCFESYDVPETALARYETARSERTRKIVEGSAANARRFHNPALAKHEAAAKYVSEEFTEDRIQERYNWLFEYDVTKVPI